MFALLLSAAPSLAAPLPYDVPPADPSRYDPRDAAAVFGPMAAQAQGREPVSLMGPGARYLDVYRAGDLAVMHDADGEWFAEALASGGDINWVLGSIEGAFYKKFEDDYQYLTILLVRDLGFFVAFYSPMANDVRGIGYDSVTPGEIFDTSDNQLDGMIFMNSYGIWTESPPVGRYVFGQEFMHRWGSFVNIEKEGLDGEALLGRDVAHWSYFYDTPNSPMEGNDWLDNGDGTWTTQNVATSTYSNLDLYLMGFVGPDEVGEQTLLIPDADAAAAAEVKPATTPTYLDQFSGGTNVTLPATPVTFTVDDIVAAEGERVPSVDDSPKSFKMAFIVLVLSEDVLDDATIAQIDGVRTTFEADWEADVGGRADLDTTLGNNTAPTWGEPLEDTAADPDADDTGTVDCCKDDAADGGPPTLCGCSGTGSPAGAALLAVAALGLVASRRRAPLGGVS